jgi:hypothetical protein
VENGVGGADGDAVAAEPAGRRVGDDDPVRFLAEDATGAEGHARAAAGASFGQNRNLRHTDS